MGFGEYIAHHCKDNVIYRASCPACTFWYNLGMCEHVFRIRQDQARRKAAPGWKYTPGA